MRFAKELILGVPANVALAVLFFSMFCEPFSASYLVAKRTLSSSPTGVGSVKGATAFTPLLSGVPCRVPVSAEDVLFVSHNFEMSWIGTSSIPAFMIQLHAIGNWAVLYLPRDTMYVEGSRLAIDSNAEAGVSPNDMSQPIPATPLNHQVGEKVSDLGHYYIHHACSLSSNLALVNSNLQGCGLIA